MGPEWLRGVKSLTYATKGEAAAARSALVEFHALPRSVPKSGPKAKQLPPVQHCSTAGA